VAGLAVSLSLAWVASSGVAHAQNASDEEAIIQHGVELRQQGNDDAALAEFHRAYDIAHSPRALAQIALAEQAVGHWVDAESHLNQALAINDPWITRNQAPLRQALETITHHVGVLDVRANVSGAELWINGVRVGTVPMDPPPHVIAGTVQIEVRAAGYTTVRRNVDVIGGVRAREDVQLLRREVGGDEPTETPVIVSSPNEHTAMVPTVAPRGGSGPRDETPGVSPLPIVVTGVGVATLIAAGVFYGLRASAIGNCTQNGDTLTCPTTMDANRASQGGTYTDVGNVLLVTGGVIAVAGVAWLVVDRMSHRSPSHHARIDVAPTPGGIALGLGGTF
jgi:hypothetical protein